jgi:hypothetical protein
MRTSAAWTLIVLAGVMLSIASTLRAQPAVQVPPSTSTIWSEGGPFSLRTIIEKAAPVLWFSPGEPLLTKGAVIPAVIRVNSEDAPARPTVFFRIESFRLLYDVPSRTPESLDVPLDAVWKEKRASATDPGLSVDDLFGLTIRYMMYYPQDIGFGGHTHDLENFLVTVDVTDDDHDAKLRAKIVDVEGLAHGIDLYSNELHVAAHDDVVFPIRILIEEGKHAVAPDRNANGIFERGYDADVMSGDAWGINDGLSSGKMPLTNRSRVKPDRARGLQLWPPPYSPDHATYDLVEAKTSEFCRTPPSDLRAVKDAATLRELTGKHGFCDERARLEDDSWSSKSRFFPEVSARTGPQRWKFGTIWTALSPRYEGGMRVEWDPLAREFSHFWVVARLNVPISNDFLRKGMSQEFLFTPSISGIVSPYGIVGYWIGSQEVEKHIDGYPYTVPDSPNRPLAEAGLKFRVKPSFAPFLGVRVGYRVTQARSSRFIVEVGRGLF